MKKFVALVMALVMCLSLLPFSALATESEAESEQLTQILPEESMAEEQVEGDTTIDLPAEETELGSEAESVETEEKLPAENTPETPAADSGTVTEYSVSTPTFNAEEKTISFTYSAPYSEDGYRYGLQYRAEGSGDSDWISHSSSSESGEAIEKTARISLFGFELVPGNYDVRARITEADAFYLNNANVATSASITISVSESDFTSLSLNGVVNLEECTTLRYRFTPNEDGVYIFKEAVLNGSIRVYDSEGTCLRSCSDTSCAVSLKGQETYWLFVYAWSENNTFTVENFVPTVTEFSVSTPSFNSNEETITFTYSAPYSEDGYEYCIQYRAEGSGDSGWITHYTRRDSGEVTEKTAEFGLSDYYMVPGNYDVRARINSNSTESATSASITISVSESDFTSLSLNGVVNLQKYETLRYSFKPEEDGVYIFKDNLADDSIQVYDSEGTCLGSCSDASCTVSLKAKETYWIFVDTWSENNTFTVGKFVPTVTEFSVSTPTFNSAEKTLSFTYSAPYSEDGYEYGWQYRKAGSDDSEWINFSSSLGSGEAIEKTAEFSLSYSRLVPGNYEVRARITEDGAFYSNNANGENSASITISVSESDFTSLSLNKTVDLARHSLLRFSFKPEEDGRYTFRFADSDKNFHIYNMDGVNVNGNYNGLSCTVSLTAGVTYWLFVNSYVIDNTLTIEKFVPSVTEFSIKKFAYNEGEDCFFLTYSAPCTDVDYAYGFQYRLIGESAWRQCYFGESCDEANEAINGFSAGSILVPGLTYEVQAIIQVANRSDSNDELLASSDILTVKVPGEPEALKLEKPYVLTNYQKCYCLKTGDVPMYIEATISDCDNWGYINVTSDLGYYGLSVENNGTRSTLLEAETTYWVWCSGDGSFCISSPEFTSLSVGDTVTVSSWKDDYRQLNVTKNQVLRFTSTGQTYLELYDSNWNELQSASLSDTAEACDFVFDKSETLYLKVNNYSDKDVTVSLLEYEPVVSAGDYKAVTGELTEDGYLTAQFTAPINSDGYYYGIWIYDSNENYVASMNDYISCELNAYNYSLEVSKFNLTPGSQYTYQAKIVDYVNDEILAFGEMKSFVYNPDVEPLTTDKDFTRTENYAVYSYKNKESTPVVLSFSSESYFYVDFAAESNQISLGNTRYIECHDYLIPGNSTVYFQVRDYGLESTTLKFQISVKDSTDVLSDLGLNEQLKASTAYVSSVCRVTAKGLLKFSLGEHDGYIAVFDENLEELKYVYSENTEGETFLSFDNSEGDTLYVQFVNYDTEADQVMLSLASIISPKAYSIQTLSAEDGKMRLKVTAPITNKSAYYGFEYCIGDNKDYMSTWSPLSGCETDQIYSYQLTDVLIPGTTIRYRAYYQIAGEDPVYATEEKTYTFNPQVKSLAFGEACPLCWGSDVYYKYTPVTDETLKLKTVGSNGGWAYLIEAKTCDFSSVNIYSSRVCKFTLEAGVTYYLYLESYNYTDSYESDTTTAVYVTKKTVANDFNGDKTVDVTDLITLVKYVLGEKTKLSLSADPDLSGNGIANLLDVVKLLRVLMQKTPS